MDVAMYAQYRAGGGTQRWRAWETAAGLDAWEDAPAPAQVGKRLYEGLLHRELAPSAARLTTNVMHWAYGSGQGAVLGLTAGSIRARGALLGPFFGAAVWTSSYVVLGVMGLYKPAWQYPPSILAKDLGNHLLYGATTGLAFAALTES